MRREAFTRRTMRTAEELDGWNGVDGEDWDAGQRGAPPLPVLAFLLGYGAVLVIGIMLAL